MSAPHVAPSAEELARYRESITEYVQTGDGRAAVCRCRYGSKRFCPSHTSIKDLTARLRAAAEGRCE